MRVRALGLTRIIPLGPYTISPHLRRLGLGSIVHIGHPWDQQLVASKSHYGCSLHTRIILPNSMNHTILPYYVWFLARHMSLVVFTALFLVPTRAASDAVDEA